MFYVYFHCNIFYTTIKSIFTTFKNLGVPCCLIDMNVIVILLKKQTGLKIFQSFSKYGPGTMQKGPTIVYKIWITILVQRYVKHTKGVLVFNSYSGEYCGSWLSSCYCVLRRFHSTIDFTAVRRNIWLRTIHSVHSCISRTTRGPIHIILQHSNEFQPLIHKLQRSSLLKNGYKTHVSFNNFFRYGRRMSD